MSPGPEDAEHAILVIYGMPCFHDFLMADAGCPFDRDIRIRAS